MNNHPPLFTVTTFQRLSILPAAVVGTLATSLWGFTGAIVSGLQRPTAAEVAAPHSSVITAGSVWGVGV